MSDRLENVTQTISRILDGYDIRLRPNFGGEYTKHLPLFRWLILLVTSVTIFNSSSDYLTRYVRLFTIILANRIVIVKNYFLHLLACRLKLLGTCYSWERLFRKLVSPCVMYGWKNPCRGFHPVTLYYKESISTLSCRFATTCALFNVTQLLLVSRDSLCP